MHSLCRNIVRGAKGGQCNSLIVCQTHRDNIGIQFLREVLFFDQLAAWTTYWPWSDLCRDFIRPCSIKSALWLSSYVPSQSLEWLPLIDVTAKYQVITAVIVHLNAAVSVQMHSSLSTHVCVWGHICALRIQTYNGVFLFLFFSFLCVCACDRPFSAIWLVGEIIIMLKAGSCSESEIQC